MKCRIRTRRKRSLQASYTIEAALLLPVFLFAIMKGLLLGVDCYQEVCASTAYVELLEEIRPAEQIWKLQLAQKGVDWIYEHTISEKSEE